jgi:ribose-phosphate pyrophosphokinase
MTAIPTTKSLKLFAGRSHPELADEVAKHLDVPLTPQSLYDFASGETFVRFDESVRGCDAFVIQSYCAPINQWVMEQLLMVDALKRASAKDITAIMPFYPYARQDKKHQGREPISARLIADLFKTAGANRIMTMDLHTDQIQGYFNGPVDHLFARNLLATYVGDNYGNAPLTVVSPDAGRAKLAEKWADDLGGCPIAFIHKTRDPLRPNEVVANRVVGKVTGRTCVVVDDMIDTGGTIVKAVKQLLDEGAAEVVVAATHGTLSRQAPELLANSGASEVILTNTLPIPDEKRFPGLTVLTVAPLLASAIQEIFESGSVSALFT